MNNFLTELHKNQQTNKQYTLTNQLQDTIASQIFSTSIFQQNQYLIKIFEQRLHKLPIQQIWNYSSKGNQQKNQQIQSEISPKSQQLTSYIQHHYIGQYSENPQRNKKSKKSPLKKSKYGLGKLIIQNKSKNSQTIYIGQWINNQKHGSGIEIDTQGNRYQGMFNYGQKEGFGIEKLVNGNKYVGQWKGNKKHGEGNYYYALLKQTYKGSYVEGKRQGKGSYLFRSGDIFKGSWMNDKKQGLGIIIYYNGDIFKGNWVNNYIQGRCSFNYKNGDYFIGKYCKGIRKGYGTYFFMTGDKLQGQWTGDNQCIGQYTDVNGDKYQSDLNKGDFNCFDMRPSKSNRQHNFSRQIDSMFTLQYEKGRQYYNQNIKNNQKYNMNQTKEQTSITNKNQIIKLNLSGYKIKNVQSPSNQFITPQQKISKFQ